MQYNEMTADTPPTACVRHNNQIVARRNTIDPAAVYLSPGPFLGPLITASWQIIMVIVITSPRVRSPVSWAQLHWLQQWPNGTCLCVCHCAERSGAAAKQVGAGKGPAASKYSALAQVYNL